MCAAILLVLVLVLAPLSGAEGERWAMFPPLPVTVLKSDNIVCKEQSDKYIQNLRNFTLWAVEMWDATAKSATGVLRGSNFQMGHFDQCVTAESPFPSKYCFVEIAANVPPVFRKADALSLDHPPDDFVLRKIHPSMDVSQQSRNRVTFGWCVPASCAVKDMLAFLQHHVDEVEVPLNRYNVTYSVAINPVLCQENVNNQQIILTKADLCFCTLSVFIVVLVISATFYDRKNAKQLENINEKTSINKKLHYRLFYAFSLIKNIADFKTVDESHPPLQILYGMRTISIIMIISYHRFGTFTSSALQNFNFVEKQYRTLLSCFLFQGDQFVDIFFLLSGLLVTYGLLNQFDKKYINPAFIVLLRYVRLTPVYAFVIFYCATLFNYTGSGPMWPLVAGSNSQDCKDNWWTNLLYINNYVNVDHMCMVPFWYLPCDFHYFIVGVALCMVFRKSKAIGQAVFCLLATASMAAPFAITYYHRRPAMMLFYPSFLRGPKDDLDFQLTYSKSHARAAPYFVGMFVGYLYYKLKGEDKHVCRKNSILVICVSLIFIFSSVFGGQVFYNPYHKYNAIEAAAYAGFHRIVFTIGVAAILFIASYGHAKILYGILAWRPWIMLGKLVYGAYLVHFQFQLRWIGKFTNPQYFSYFDLISLAISDIVLSFLLAFVLYVGIETPFRRIFKELLLPPAQHRKENEEKIKGQIEEQQQAQLNTIICYDNPLMSNQNCSSHL